MTNQRYSLLMNHDYINLTPEEIAQGWHFCYEFDGLLRQPMDESDVLMLKGDGTTTAFKCTCLDPNP